MAAGDVEQVRRFNRTVTQRAGALDDHFLALDRPLGEARLLWEVGLEGCEVRALRSRLDLDSGHASRLLRSLEADGMVEVVPGPSDKRVRVARLTEAGLMERATLDERSDARAEEMLGSLSRAQRERLMAAMRDVELLLTAARVELRPVDPTHADARQCFRAYFSELDRRSESGFDPERMSIVDPDELRSPAGTLLIAYLGDDPIGCGAVRHHPGAPTEIKRMWVAETARGLGIGRRLLEALETLATEAGAPAAQLETNKALAEAIALYRSTGYREVPAFNDEPFGDFWFEKRL